MVAIHFLLPATPALVVGVMAKDASSSDLIPSSRSGNILANDIVYTKNPCRSLFEA